MSDDQAELRVSAHVLIQLGTELVTDVDQALLEIVKNAYDADAPGCSIEIATGDYGAFTDEGPSSRYQGFDDNTESVHAEVQLLKAEAADGSSEREGGTTRAAMTDTVETEMPNEAPAPGMARRTLSWQGRITVTDTGHGLSPEQIASAWLVVSGSGKRVLGGPKKKTALGRTPLGDKGLGRLGTMRLGDILQIESTRSPHEDIRTARFRWSDCEAASTVDRIPVEVGTHSNPEGFKGSRVSVFGLNELAEWRRPKRAAQLASSLARLVSPFEATSTFPVSVKLDGNNASMSSVTSEALAKAVARFDFQWSTDEDASSGTLKARARFQRRLLSGSRAGKSKAYDQLIFKEDGGRAFLSWLGHLPKFSKKYQLEAHPERLGAFLTLRNKLTWSAIKIENASNAIDPGPFNGAFYYFNLNDLGELDKEAAAGLGIDRELVKSMAGISILRDGFRVRASGDWLDLAGGMTSGSTYHMRVANTLGYFALSGELNHLLVEKSDREGFVDNAAFRGFSTIATACRHFANDALEDTRRAADEWCRRRSQDGGSPPAPTGNAAFRLMEEHLASASQAGSEAASVAEALQGVISSLEGSPVRGSVDAADEVKGAVAMLAGVQRKLQAQPMAGQALERLRLDDAATKEQLAALYESAAVGLSARGLAHELRGQLDDIRQQTEHLQKQARTAHREREALPHLRAIRSSCTVIAKAAALLDPLLPRTRTVKETLHLAEFIRDYVSNRSEAFERERVAVRVEDRSKGFAVRASRARLLQVLDNLVQNSRYWLRRGEFTGEVSRAKAIEIVVWNGGFDLADTGPGVDPRYEEALFEMFVSSKPERGGGQGLGLFIVRQLLRLDGGDIGLEAERNADGRLFRFKVDLGDMGRET